MKTSRLVWVNRGEQKHLETCYTTSLDVDELQQEKIRPGSVPASQEEESEATWAQDHWKWTAKDQEKDQVM